MSDRTPAYARRRKVVTAALLGFALLTTGVSLAAEGEPVPPAPVEEAAGPYFGEGNVPASCQADMSATLPDGSANPKYWLAEGSQATCHHMRTGLNALDTPQVDVLVLVPASPTAERDMRIMRQAVEMWEGGLDSLAEKLDLDWLADGTDFKVTVDTADPAGSDFTPYAVADPEIVVVATNPVGGIGIGIDPVDFASQLGVGDGEGLCHGIANPLSFDAWSALPGFDSHHGLREGVYTEDCGGAGGNVCFAVNGAIDPTPGEGPLAEFFTLFDLVAHEVGHCLTVGHVGDGAEGDWGGLPTNDIMAYNADPGPLLNKCVSTLDVEGFAVRMSKYLDVDGDGAVTPADELKANDQAGDGSNAFQVQRPQDHFYASPTGLATDCPQPDLALLPGAERTDWRVAPADAEATPAPAPETGGETGGETKAKGKDKPKG